MFDVVVITGPTATGKTALGIALAKLTGGEIISADSMQVYQKMNIGTAKPTAEELTEAVHHMIDVADPKEDYSVAKYVNQATVCIEKLRTEGRLPIIVGGTGFYIKALLQGGGFAGAPKNSKVREQLENEYDQIGREAFWNKLRIIDPEKAEKLSMNDKKRVVRAMEIYCLTGQTMSEYDRRTKEIKPKWKAKTIILDYKNREELYSCIDERVDRMIEKGLVKEVEELLKNGLTKDSTAMQAIGYKEIVRFLEGDLSKEEAIEAVKRESRRYAKRQRTWLRNEEAERILWNNKPDRERIDILAERIAGEL